MTIEVGIPGGVRAGRRYWQNRMLEAMLAAGKRVAFCNAAGVRVMHRHASGLVVIESKPYDSNQEHR